ncbi:MAG: hypothetical protein ABII12_06065 [Planctomycetota bacterium]
MSLHVAVDEEIHSPGASGLGLPRLAGPRVTSWSIAMNLDAKRHGLAFVLLVVAALVFVSAARAADPPEPGEHGAAQEKAVTEQSIYIPYTKLRSVFEKEGRGVFLPYEEFQELWRAARDNMRLPPDDEPPVSALITEARNEATVLKDVVRVSSELKIEVLAEGWSEIPLRLADAAITRAVLDGKPARIVFEPGVGHKLLVERKDRQAGVLALSLEYVKAFTKSPGQNGVSFEAPQAPVSRWRIHIPEAGVKVSIRPLIAATEVPEDDQPGEQPARTVVLAFVGAAPTVRIDWTPKSEGATGLEALANVQSEQQVTVDEGVTRTRSRLHYDISRAELSRLLIELPATHKIVNVFDPNIRQWSVETVEGCQRITADLFEPAKKTQDVTVELEKFTKPKAESGELEGLADEPTGEREAALPGGREELQVPVIRALGVGRQQGVVVVEVAAGLRAEVTRHTGLMQVDTTDLPASLAKGGWAFSYRYVSLPFDFSLRVEQVQPRITADSLVVANLQPEQLTLDMVVVCSIERAGVFRLELDIPAGYEVRHVRGCEAAGAEPAQVDTHYLEGDAKTHLVVNLSRKALGRVALAVQFQRRLAEPDLLSPTGKTAELQLDIPRVTRTTVERSVGRLLVRAPESLRVNPHELEGLRSISFKEAAEGLAPLRDDRGARPVLAYAYTQEDVRLTLAVERRKPHVTARQLLKVQVEAGVMEYAATFFYEIRYSGVKSLRVDLPADLAGEIRNETPNVREKEIEPPPEDLPEGYVAWSLAGETEFSGNVTIRLAWEEKIEKLDVGRTIERTIPHLRPAAVDRAWGQIVLAKAETIDVQATGEPRGIRPIDPQHDLMAGADAAGGALAFEFHDDWVLDVTATRYQLEEVKRTSIERAVIQMVVTRSGQTSVRALYRMRSARQRLAVELPENVDFDNEPLRINGRPVPLERGDKHEFFIPLSGQDADAVFLLELRYSVEGGGTRLECPVFSSEPAIQKVYLYAYLPEELAYLGWTGPWTDEQGWQWGPILDSWSFPKRGSGRLIDWVSHGLKVAENPAGTFHTDGHPYLFSTLRPPQGGEGALRLFTMDEDWLTVLVLAPVILVGVFLLRKRATARWLAAGTFVVLLVLASIFIPTFVAQIVDDKLLCAVLVVLVAWMIRYVGWIRPYDPVVAARRKVREEAAIARIQAKAAKSRVASKADTTEEGGQTND